MSNGLPLAMGSPWRSSPYQPATTSCAARPARLSSPAGRRIRYPARAVLDLVLLSSPWPPLGRARRFLPDGSLSAPPCPGAMRTVFAGRMRVVAQAGFMPRRRSLGRLAEGQGEAAGQDDRQHEIPVT